MVDVSGLNYVPHDLALPPGDLWVFGYGSLMWNPGFPYLEKHSARLHGYHRALCVWSWVHRGTQDHPGLVLGLDRGGACVGRLLRVAEAEKPKVADYLYRREMATPVYVPTLVPVAYGAPGRRRKVRALTFTIDREHAQYAGRLSVERAYETAATAVGRSGANPQYVLDAVDHIRELGIRDAWLEDLAERLRVLS